MPSKATDRIKALQQQRASALAPPPPAPPPATDASPAGLTQPAPTTDVDDVQAHFGGVIDQLVRNRQVQRIPIGQIAPDARPEMQQPRLLPTPDVLMPNGRPAPLYADLIAELHTLGRSLQTQQIQPIVVYPGTNAAYPAARYLMLVGQRRWTAASLVGLDSIDAIVVEPPTSAERIRIQYAENEDREEFSDMERAWSLQQMKDAMDDAPWEAVEERLQLSRTRRHQLTRLFAFSPVQQRLVARLRLQETQIRPLHTAVRNQELSAAQVDGVLQRLAELVSARGALAASSEADAATGSGAVARRGVDGPTIARLVARAQRTNTVIATSTPRWVSPLQEQVLRTRQALQRANGRIDLLGTDDAEALRAVLQQFRADLDHTLTVLADRLDTDAGEEA